MIGDVLSIRAFFQTKDRTLLARLAGSGIDVKGKKVTAHGTSVAATDIGVIAVTMREFRVRLAEMPFAEERRGVAAVAKRLSQRWMWSHGLSGVGGLRRIAVGRATRLNGEPGFNATRMRAISMTEGDATGRQSFEIGRLVESLIRSRQRRVHHAHVIDEKDDYVRFRRAGGREVQRDCAKNKQESPSHHRGQSEHQMKMLCHRKSLPEWPSTMFRFQTDNIAFSAWRRHPGRDYRRFRLTTASAKPRPMPAMILALPR